MVASGASETAFWSPCTAQIHARSVARTPFQTVSVRSSRKFAKKIPKKGIPLLGFIADSSLSVIVMSGIAHPTGGANRQMGRANRQERGGANQQEGGGANQQGGRIVVSIVVTAVALAFVVAHLIWPDLEIDAIALAFVGIAIVPWLGPLLESIEFPGGFKATFREVEQRIEEVKKTTDEALTRTEEVHQTAQAALSETQAVKETAQAALSETQEVKEAAQAALSRTEEIDKKVG
jgi:hypothetical protein